MHMLPLTRNAFPYSPYCRMVSDYGFQLRGRFRIFPNRASAVRLLGALLLEQHEQWITGRHYLDMTAYWQWRQNHSETTEGAVETA